MGEATLSVSRRKLGQRVIEASKTEPAWRDVAKATWRTGLELQEMETLTQRQGRTPFRGLDNAIRRRLASQGRATRV